ncbi:MAG: DUF3303 family protein [Methanomicrobiaceae archaeon]|uniref:DUF3303 domain-containing protein n=1 Tax=hydrocarbon metagenome TaxID=938273 RepID=A0A0W8FJW5_9ZZZZ|nr:DUF3303 family protein [Methanomicrobiaceae archaeon]MDD5420135.1 DUF3303 family protein [Methanomicrobiaceae archaeon]
MLFVLWYQFEPEHVEDVHKLWREYKYPDDVKVINRFLLIGRHMSVAVFEAQSEESLLKITAPFSKYGIAHIAPAMPLEEAVAVR